MGSDGPRVSCVRWGSRSPHVKGRFWGIGVPLVKYRDFLPWAVQKRQNRLICHLGCGLHWAEACTRSVIFAKWRQSAPRHSSMSCAKMAQPIDLPFGLWTGTGWGSTSLIVFASRCQYALMGGHIAASWRIRLNHLSASPMCLMPNYFQHLLSLATPT